MSGNVKKSKPPLPKDILQSGTRAASTIFALEQRIAFDGAFTDTLEKTITDQTHSGDHSINAHDGQASGLDHTGNTEPSITFPLALVAFDLSGQIAIPRTEIVFVDPTVPDVAKLFAGIRPGVEVVMLDPLRDGVSQIAHALEGRHDIDAIHLISHGSAGTLLLGTTTLTAETMAGRYAEDLARIGSSLSTNADILVYGCDFAKGVDGKLAADVLGQKTGADVAASDDLTGHDSLGGDWVLEYDFGRIDANTVIRAELAGQYVHVLAAPVIDLNGATAGINNIAAFTENQLNGTTGTGSNEAAVLVLAPSVTVTAGNIITSIEVTMGGIEAKNAEYLNVNGSGGITFQLDDIRSISNYGMAGINADISYDATTNKLTITRNGGGTITDAQATTIIKQITYYNVLDNVTSNTRTVSFVAKNNLAETSLVASTTINITEVNDAPTVGAIYVDTNGNNTYDLGEASTGYYNSNITPNSSISQVIHQRYVDVPVTADPASLAVTISLARIDNSFNIKINGVSIILTKSQIEVNNGDYNSGTDYRLSVDADSNGIGDDTAFFSSPWVANTNTNTPRLVITIKEGSITFEGTQNSTDAWSSRKVFALPAGALVLPDFVNGRNIIEMYNLDDPGGDLIFGKIEAKLDPSANLARPTGVAITPVNMAPTFSDPDGDTLTFTSSGMPPGLSISSGGIISGTPTTQGLYTVVVTATDTSGASISSNVLFNITNSNVAPIASNDTVLVNEDSFINFDPKLNDNDPNGDTLTITQINGTAISPGATVILAGGNTVKLETNGTLTVTPAANVGSGDILFTYTVRDPGGLTSIGNVKASIQAVNDAPINTLPASGWTITEDTPSLALTGLSIVDIDAASGTLTVTLSVNVGTLTATTGGSVTVAGSGTTSIILTGTLANLNTFLAGASTPKFIPNSNFNGAVTLTMLTDDAGNTGAGNVLTDNDTRTITVTAVNDAPVNSQTTTSWSTVRNTSVRLTGLSISDVDAAAGTMTITLSAPTGTFSATSGSGVTVSGSGSSSIVFSGTLTALNAYLGSVSAPLYAPLTNSTSSVTMTMTTNDGGNTGSGGSLTDVDSNFIIIISPPVAVADTFQTPHDRAVTIDVRLNDSDIEGPVSITKINGTTITVGGAGVAVTGGVVTLNAAGILIFTPTANYLGSPSFTYTIVDSDGNVATTTVTGNVFNTDPVVSLTNSTNLLVNGDFDSVFAPNLNANNNIYGTSWGGWSGTAPINPIRVDGTGYGDGADNANTGNQYIDIAGPGTAFQTFTLTSANTYSFGAEFSNRASAIGGYAPPAAYVEILNSSNTVMATSNSLTLLKSAGDEVWYGSTGIATLAAGTYTYRITLGDYGHVDSAYVRPLNNATTFTENGPAVSIANTLDGVFDRDDTNMESATITLSNPQTGDRLLVNGLATASGVLAGGIAWTRTDSLVTLTGTGTKADYAIAIRAIQFENTTDTPATTARIINVVVNDGTANSNTATTTISIDRAPDPVADAFFGNEDTAITDNVLANDTDLGDTPITSVTVTTAPANGTLTSFNTTTGAFNYLANLNYVGTDTFVYTVTDADGDTKTALVTITVNAVNDAPTGTNNTITINEDSTRTLTAADFGFSDIEGNALQSVTIVTEPTTGILFLSGVRVTANQVVTAANIPNLTYVPNPDGNGTGYGSFTFKVTDNGGTANSGINTDITARTMAFNVTAINDAPALWLGSTNLVTNGSFESGATGWTGNSGVEISSSPGTYGIAPAPNGVSFLELEGGILSPSTTQAYLEQTITTLVGQTYTFELKAHMRTNAGTLDMGSMSVNGIELDRFTTNNSWQTFAVTFTATSTSSVIRMTSLGSQTGASAPGDGAGLMIDDVQVRAVNTTRSFTENGAVISIADSVTTIADVDDTNIEQASIVLTNAQAGDALSIVGTLPPGISSAINTSVPGQVTVTLTGSASKAAYQTALTQIGFVNGSDTPSTTPRVINITVNDGDNSSNVAVSTITVISVNDAPINTLPTGWSVAEDAASLTLSGLSIEDYDAASGSMTITLSVTSGTLLASAGGSVTVSGSGGTSIVLTGTKANLNTYLSGAFTPQFVPVANFNGTVTLTMLTNDGGNTGTGGVLTDSDTRTITVTAVNDAPTLVTAIPDQASLEDQAVSYTVPAATFADIDSTLTYTATLADGSALPLWLSFNTTTRQFTGTPPLNFNGVLDLKVVATDGQYTVSDTFLLTIQPVNDAPAGADKTVFVAEDTAYVFSAADFGFSDTSDTPANSFLQVKITTLPTSGSLKLAGIAVALNDWIPAASISSLTWTPALNDNGMAVASLRFAVQDNGGTTNGGLNTDATPNRITFDVTAVNDAPTVGVAQATLNGTEDTTLVITGITLTDVDASNNSVTVTISIPAGQGTISWTATAFISSAGSTATSLVLSGSITAINAALAANKLSVTPAIDANGTVPLSISINDNGNNGTGGPLTGSSAINLVFAAVNDAPVLASALADKTILEDQPVSFTLPAGSFTDVDSAITLSATLNGGAPLPSWLAFNPATRQFTGTPPTNFTGVLDIKVVASDGQYTANDIFLLTIQPVNDAPTGADSTITINEDTTYNFSVSNFGFADTNDTPNNSLQDVRIDTIPSNGVLKLSGTAVSAGSWIAAANIANLAWTPNPDANGVALASFTFTVRDNGGTANGGVNADPIPNRITFNVTPVNDAPVPPVVGSQNSVDSQAISLNVSFTDIDSPTITYSAFGLPSGLTIDPVTGIISGTVDPSASQAGSAGVYTIKVIANDGNGAESAIKFDWTITNPAPIAKDDDFTTDEDTPFSGNLLDNDSDPDFDALTADVTPDIPPSNGTVVINTDGTFTYTPNPDFNGSDSFTYILYDADGAHTQATVKITVNAVNDAPDSAVLPARAAVDGASININLGATFSDIDGDALSYIITGLPAGLIYDPSTGVVTGAINHSASQGGAGGVYNIQVLADDGNGGVAIRSFGWTITNPTPDAKDDAISTNQNTPTAGSVYANHGSGADVDPDGDTLTVIAVNGVAGNVGTSIAGSNGGTFTITSTGSYTFNPGADFIDVPVGQTRATTITYTVSDGEGGFDTATVTVSVAGINDVPTVGTIGTQINLDSDAVSFNIAPFFNDPDYDPLTFSQSGLPTGLTINATTGLISGTINHSASQTNGGNYSVTVTANDGHGGVISQTFVWSVSNPTPTAVNDVVTVTEDVAKTIDVLLNDTDPDADPPTIIATGPNAPTAGNGTVSIVAGKILYTPNPNFNGTDTIIYSIADGDGGFSTAQVSVTVTAVNDTPFSVLIPDHRNNVNSVVAFGISSFFDDVDKNDVGSTEMLSFGITGLPPGLTLNPTTGQITGTVDPSATTGSPYTVSVTATDSGGLQTTRTFVWQIYNDVPVAVDDTVTTPEDTAKTFNVMDGSSSGGFPDYDPEALPLTVVSATAGNGTVTYNTTTGAMTYTPNANFNGIDTIVYTIQDVGGNQATAYVTVNVTPVNDAPMATVSSLPNIANADSDPVTLVFGSFFDDIDLHDSPSTEALVFTASSLPPGLSMNPTNGAITGTINPSASGPTGSLTYAVTITARDTNGTGLQVSKTFNWTVTNPAPSATNDSFTTVEDIAKTVNLLANDSDPDSDPLVVDLATAGHGTVVINGNGTVTYTPDANFNGTDTIIYRISDGNGGFATASVAVTVTAVNDAPTSTLIGNQTSTDSTSVSVNVRAFFDDVDLNDQIADTLAFSATGLPRGLSINTVTGAITGTLARDVSQDFPGGVHSVTITATDSGDLTTSRSLSWTVINPPPVALNDIASGNEDTVITGTLLGNDSDVDGDPLTVVTTPVSGPSNGTLVLNSSGTYQYTPATNFNGTDSFTYRVSDGNGGFATAIATITVIAVNDAPVAGNDTTSTNEDTAITFNVLGTDSDVDGDTLTVTSASGSNGTVIINANGTLTYQPNANFNGTDTITYTISDGHGGTSTATVSVTVVATNDPPVAIDDVASAFEDTPLTINVLANDTDLDGDALTVTTANATNGTVVIELDGTLTFTPAPNYNGPAAITYTISDGHGGTAIATVNITVIAVNDAPVASSPAVFTTEDTPQNGGITVTDVDGGGPVFLVLTAPTNGTLTLNTDGTYTYAPNANFNGTDSFTVSVSDGNGGTTTVTIPVTIAPVNDAPTLVAAAPDRSSPEDQPFSFSVPPASFTDIDGPSLSLTATLADGSALPVWVIFNPATGSFTGTPPQDFNGFIDIKVTGSDGTLSVSDTFRLTITPVNDAPVAINGSLITQEDTAFFGTLPVATDVDGDSLSYSTGGTAPAHGNVTINSDGTYTYTPAPNYNGPDSFTYRVTDGGVSVERTVMVTVTPVNDAPVAAFDTVTTLEDTPVTLNVLGNDTDVDGNALAITAIDGQPIAVGTPISITGGTVTLNVDGTLTFSPNANFFGNPTFTYGISDGAGGSATASVTVTVTPVNDAPVVALALPDISSLEDQPLSFSVPAGSFTDIDGPAATYTATLANGSPLPAWLMFNPTTQSFSGTPPLDYVGSVTIKVTASDGNLTASDTFSLIITPVNDAPVVNNHSFTTAEDAPFIGTLPVATDVDGDALTYGLGSTTPTHGTVTVNADGTFSYAPDPDYHGPDTFSYVVSDGTVNVERTVTVTVTSVNDVPIATNDFNSTDPLLTVTGTVLPNDYDLKDNDVLTVASVNGTAMSGASITVAGSTGGLLTIAADGSYTFDPNGEFSALAPGVYATTAFTYTIADGNGGAATASLTITVPGVNDPPTAVSDIVTTAEDTSLTFDPRLNDTDPELNPLVITMINGQPISMGNPVTLASGSIEIGSDGRLTFTPTPDFSGAVNLTYTVFDQVDGYATGAIRINVTPTNDAPIVVTPPVDRTVLEDQPFGFTLPANTFADVDTALLTLNATLTDGSPLPSWIGFNPVTRNFSGTPPLDYAGVITVKVTASDGVLATAATFQLIVASVNDAPTGADAARTTAEDTPYVFSAADFGFSDTRDAPANALFSVIINSLPNTGIFTLNGNGIAVGQTIAPADIPNLIWTPPANAHGANLASFTFRVQDNGGTVNGGIGIASVANTLSLSVTPVNDAPIANPDVATTAFGTAVTINILGNDTDVDGDTLTVTAALSPNGTVTINSDGTIVFTPTQGFTGEAVITATISDGHGGVVTSLVRVQVGIAPPAPILSVVQVQTNEGLPTAAAETVGKDTPFRTISATGIIVSAVNTISDLNGIFVPLDADRPLLTAVNGMSRLNATVELGRGGSILDPAVMGLTGGQSGVASSSTLLAGTDALGSTTNNPSQLFGETGLTLNRTMNLDVGVTSRNGTLHLNVREHGVVGRDLCRKWLDVRGIDDQPMPEWLHLIQDGEFAGKPPSDLQSIDLKLVIRLDDGSEVVRLISLDLKTGAITPLAEKDHASLNKALFSHQLAAAVSTTPAVFQETSLLQSLL